MDSAMVAAQASTLVPSLTREIRRHLDLVTDLPARLDRPNLAGARESAVVFRECFQSLSALAHLEAALARAVDLEALYRSFDAFVAFRAGEWALTTSALLEAWVRRTLADLQAQESIQAELAELASAWRELESDLAAQTKDLAAVARSLIRSPDYAEWLVLFHQAVEQIAVPELGGEQARAALRSLSGRLELGQDDLGRMIGVSGETIRRWERGAIGIPAERRAEILAAEAGLRRLQELFLPERLPTAIRRPAELFDGETALAWILRGRIAEVADRYETALLYQT
jgi:transcriptional regulator with XRE-family HTH domain